MFVPWLKQLEVLWKKLLQLIKELYHVVLILDAEIPNEFDGRIVCVSC